MPWDFCHAFAQVMHYYCSGPGMPEPKYLAMASFNTKKQVYTSIGDLSLLPFTPPPFLSFVLQQLGGTFKVRTHHLAPFLSSVVQAEVFCVSHRKQSGPAIQPSVAHPASCLG